jgi:hypothetical protein
MTPAAATPYWNGLADEEFARFERRQRFVDFFAAVLSDRQAAVLGVVGEECWERGRCALSIDALAQEACVGRGVVHKALGAARRLGIVEVREQVIHMISSEWQALLEEEGRAGAR